MTQLHFGVKQLKIDRTMGVLYSFGWNHVKYANMEGFRRDSHNLQHEFLLRPDSQGFYAHLHHQLVTIAIDKQ